MVTITVSIPNLMVARPCAASITAVRSIKVRTYVQQNRAYELYYSMLIYALRAVNLRTQEVTLIFKGFNTLVRTQPV